MAESSILQSSPPTLGYPELISASALLHHCFVLPTLEFNLFFSFAFECVVLCFCYGALSPSLAHAKTVVILHDSDSSGDSHIGHA